MISMLSRLATRPTLSTTMTWFRALSLTPVCRGQPPPEVFRGSNWQPADVIRTDDHPEPMGVPDDWDKYNRIVYPPALSGETPRKGVRIERIFKIEFFFRDSLFIIVERICEEILRNIGFLLKW